ncbi:MAG TPA: type II CAAX endopeptidase family protein [Verrucomicrobiae bacterium]|jgi:hypothetical protein
MRPIRALLIYLILVFLGGALLAPWLWHLAQFFSSPFPKIAAAPFHRFLDRAFLLLALVGIWPLMRSLGATSWPEVGLPLPHGQMKKLSGGFLLGLLSLGMVAAIEIGAGRRAFNHVAAHQIVSAIISAFATAAVVAILEEILFRGAIFGGLRRVLYWPFALFFSSIIFAFVHFLSRADIAGPVEWDSGLVLLSRLFDLHAFIPGFLGLTLVGLILGLAYQRTGTLYFSIGLHGTWILILKIVSSLTVQVTAANNTFWGSDKMVDGWLSFIALAFTLAILNFLPLERRPPYLILK